MGLVDDLIGDVILDGIHYMYFKWKNKKRAKLFDAFAREHGLSFSATVADYHGEIMQIKVPSSAELKSEGHKRLSRKAKHASRLYGDSPFQTKLWAFVTNRYRGDWQSNYNISEGTWNGRLVTSFDTLWFDAGASQEGEYTSVFAHCKGEVPQVIIRPGGAASFFKQLEEDQVFNRGYHRQQFESAEFNKAWHVSSVDQRLASDFISQEMMEYLLEHKDVRWSIELSPGGVLVSSIYSLSPTQVKRLMDFLTGLLEHIDADLLGGSAQ